MNALETLKQILVDKSFKYSDEPSFPLVSGRLSQYYVDCKTTLSQPEAREAIGQLAVEMVGDRDFDAVGGMELGAYPVAIAVSDAFYRLRGQRLRVFVIRKEAKAHGLKKWIEGDVGPGDRALIVDDVITSGLSTKRAVERSRESGLTVETVLALIDREEGGREALEDAHVVYQGIVTLQDLRRFIGK